MMDFRHPRSPHYASYLCQVRAGIVMAFDDADDDRVAWSLLEAIELVDTALDSVAPSVDPASTPTSCATPSPPSPSTEA
jgi:hypothetical protein